MMSPIVLYIKRISFDFFLCSFTRNINRYTHFHFYAERIDFLSYFYISCEINDFVARKGCSLCIMKIVKTYLLIAIIVQLRTRSSFVSLIVFVFLINSIVFQEIAVSFCIEIRSLGDKIL